MSAVDTTAAPAAVRFSLLALARRAALPLVFFGSCAYQFVQGRAHAAPTVFSDELLYSKLAQAIAAGHGLAIRGAHYSFPSPVAPLLQAPAWLLGSMTEGYAAAKLLNAIVMSAAAFPAYWLALRVVGRRSFALVTAAAAVATPAMVYHAYLMSEAAAYPVFLLAVYVIVRAVEEPSRRLGLAVPAVCALAVATRVQFIVLPLVYVAAVAVCGRRREHLVPVTLLALLGAAVALVPGSLGSYGDAGRFHYGLESVAQWTLTNAALLPFSLGLAVVPGALVGLAYCLVQPRRRVERVFAVVAFTTSGAFLVQTALVSAGEAHRPLERYLFYVTPLVFTAFFAYAERGAPRRVVHLGVAGVFALLLSQFSLSGLTGTAGFFFDSVTESAYARGAYRLGLANASLLFSLLPIGFALLAVTATLRRRSAAIAVALTAIGLQLWLGTAVASTDHLVTGWAQRTFGTSTPDWLDRSGLGPARELVLPDSTGFYGAQLESWNRNLTGIVLLQAPASDAFARSVARVRDDGTLEIDGEPAASQLVVVNTSGSQLGLEGHVVARPRPELVAYRIPARAHVRWLAAGVFPDRWSGSHVRYQVWPAQPSARGRYVVALGLPRGYSPRPITVRVPGGAHRSFVLRPGRTVRVSLPVAGVRPPALRIGIDVPLGALQGRVLGVRVLALRYVPAATP